MGRLDDGRKEASLRYSARYQQYKGRNCCDVEDGNVDVVSFTKHPRTNRCLKLYIKRKAAPSEKQPE